MMQQVVIKAVSVSDDLVMRSDDVRPTFVPREEVVAVAVNDLDLLLLEQRVIFNMTGPFSHGARRDGLHAQTPPLCVQQQQLRVVHWRGNRLRGRLHERIVIRAPGRHGADPTDDQT